MYKDFPEHLTNPKKRDKEIKQYKVCLVCLGFSQLLKVAALQATSSQ